MASLDTSRTTYGFASLTNRTFVVLSDMMNALNAWNDARVTNNALSSLTDRELADIGLSRGDIADVSRSFMIR